MAYRVPPSEFLQVLVEGDTTRLGALHAVLQVCTVMFFVQCACTISESVFVSLRFINCTQKHHKPVHDDTHGAEQRHSSST